MNNATGELMPTEKELARLDSYNRTIRRTRTVITFILLALVIIILAACIALYALLRPGGVSLFDDRKTAGIAWIRSIYGHDATDQGLINPSSVAFSADGESIWITDSARFRLVQYDLNGRLMQIVNADWRVNEMIFPTRIAISSKGWFYVAEQTYDRVQIFDSDFIHQATIQIEGPTAVAANDDLLLVGSRRGFAQFTYNGDFIGMHSADSEDEVNHFDYVHALALDESNNSFVLDSFGNRLVKYDEEGIPLYEILLGPPGNQGISGGRAADTTTPELEFPANLQLPKGLALDDNGHIYIIDMFDFSIAVLDVEEGDFIKKVGSQGIADGSFDNPNCLDYNPAMDIFASAEATLGRVQLLSIEGSSRDPLAQTRRDFGDFINACLIPLIIVLILMTAYFVSQYLAKRHRRKRAQLTE